MERSPQSFIGSELSMSFVMSAEERETFLSDPHLGVFAIERAGRAPLAVPVWYDYRPGGEVLVWIDRTRSSTDCWAGSAG